MTEHALETHADAPPVLSFNFPNEASLAGNLKLGWELVEHLIRYYRFQDPGRVVGSVPGPLERSLETSCRFYNSSREILGSSPPSDVTVTRQPSIPSGRLADIGRAGDPDCFHVPRDEQFYEWRYGRPDRRYEVFTARRDDSPVGAAIVSDDGTTVRITEFVPRMGRPEEISVALLRSIVRTYDDAAAVITLTEDLETSVLRSFGFHDGRNVLLAQLLGERPFMVRPITGDDLHWHLEGADLRVPSNWQLSFGDIDVA